MDEFKEIFYTYRGYETAAGSQKLTPSMEDYLEMIYRLTINKEYTRVNDLSDKLNVKPPSVTKMMHKLHKRGFLEYEKYGMIQLTEQGKKIGAFLLERHNVIRDFFTILGLTENVHQDVEQIEHHITLPTFLHIKNLVAFMQDNIDVRERFCEYLQKNHL